MCTDAEIVGAWLLDGDGTDSSGNSNDGVITGDPGWVAGKFGQAMDAKPDKYIDFPPPTSEPMMVDNFTVMVWVNPNQWIGGWQAVFSMQAGGTGQEIYGIYFGNSGGKEILLWTTGTNITTGQGGLDLGVWTHAAVTYDGSKLVLYKNGEQAVEKNFAGPVDNKDRTGRFVINGNYNSLNGGLAEFCDSLIDEVLIFDEALTLDDIKDYMDNGFAEVAGITAVDASGKLTTTWGKIRTVR
jgi:hypothetical protein